MSNFPWLTPTRDSTGWTIFSVGLNMVVIWGILAGSLVILQLFGVI